MRWIRLMHDTVEARVDVRPSRSLPHPADPIMISFLGLPQCIVLVQASL